MKRTKSKIAGFLFLLLVSTGSSCRGKNHSQDETLPSIDLKRGKIISCGPPEKQLGEVRFETSCPESVKKDFDMGIALLHSFEYDEAEKVFAGII
ncbi:MAG: hypothetical protein ABI688_10685, partial [Bacteroidota bacterium]